MQVLLIVKRLVPVIALLIKEHSGHGEDEED
jgi:hypothetical protein